LPARRRHEEQQTGARGRAPAGKADEQIDVINRVKREPVPRIDTKCPDNSRMDSIIDAQRTTAFLDAPSRWPGLLAAIDMGSNSFRLEIGEVPRGGRYRRVDYLKETVRLGGGLDENGLLTPEAVRRGLACLERFSQRLKGFAPHQVRAVATQTLREAKNRDAFLLQARTVLGYPIEVISGREEARLIYAGVARLQPSDKPRLVIDIGGRSTEMILGRGRNPERAESFQVGSVSLSLKYFGDGRFTESAFRAAQVAAGAELEEALVPFARQHWTEALGSSGTVGAVAQLLTINGISRDGSITPEGLRWCIEQCLEAGH
jgi:exopolyphosphatase/guanosine-5'-triphosphate,3'-diphosphate pyrophosphatase